MHIRGGFRVSRICGLLVMSGVGHEEALKMKPGF